MVSDYPIVLARLLPGRWVEGKEVGMNRARRAMLEDQGVESHPLPDGERADKRPTAEPRLTFVAPKLVKHGGLADLTFSAAFSPPDLPLSA